jgi:hypothetical protein
MRYRDATSFRQALEQRLKDRFVSDSTQIARARKRIAFDRLLARLAEVAPGQWLLKGGFALDLHLSAKARSTKDVDIEWRSDNADLLDTLLDATARDLNDFFILTIEGAGVPEDRLGGSHRFKMSTALAGRPFESFLLDVGFSAKVTTGRTTTVSTGSLLDFAGIEPTEVDSVALELQVAEKLHALSRTYEGGRTSTRTKDLVDIVLVSNLSSLDAQSLHQDLRNVFSTRATHEIPDEVPSPPLDWTEPFRRLANEVGLPTELVGGHREAAAMLNPILTGEVSAARWSPENRQWES